MGEKKASAFDKVDSLCLKGLAIFMLMCIHCFGNASRFEGYAFDFGFIGEDLYIQLAYYCKICVCIFAFISGYGLYLSAKKTCSLTDEKKWISVRIIKTMNGFWFLYIVSIISLWIYERIPDTVYFNKGVVRGSVYVLLDFLGLAQFFGTPSMNSSWWYMSAAIVFVILMPLLVKWCKNHGWFSLFAVIIIIPRVLFNGEFFGATNIYSFVLPVCIGALFAEFDLFAKINKIRLLKNDVINEIALFCIGLFIVFVSIWVWLRLPYKLVWEYHFGIAPVILIVFCNRFIFKEYCFVSKIIRCVASFLGKHSMNMFIFHTFFRVYFFKEFIYNLKYPILTIISLLMISLAFSVIVEFVKKMLHYQKLIDFLETKITYLFSEKNKNEEA